MGTHSNNMATPNNIMASHSNNIMGSHFNNMATPNNIMAATHSNNIMGFAQVSIMLGGETKMSDPPRLVVDRIVLENFKSYAGKIVVGPLHTAFSAVVGPNGAGKSNVIDALLFVFGYRANKMRQTKLAQLIHVSDEHSNLESATVSVHFCEVTESVVPGTDFVVARSVYKNGQSKYFLNAVPSTYTEVTSILKDKGVDLEHKRFLILQGEVESIALMKAKGSNENDEGLLEYLEDIIGSNRYKKGIEDAQAKLEEINERRNEKVARVRLVELDKSRLHDQKHEAENVLQMTMKLRRKKVHLWTVQSKIANESLQRSVNELDVLKTQYEHMEEENKDLAELLKGGLEQKVESAIKAAKKAAERCSLLQKQLDGVSNEDVKIREHKKSSVRRAEKLRKEIEKNNAAATSSAQWMDNYEKDAKRDAIEFEELNKRLKQHTEEFEKMSESVRFKTHKIKQRLMQAETELLPWNEKRGRVSAELTALRDDLDYVKAQMSRLTEAMQSAETRAQEASGIVDLEEEMSILLKGLQNELDKAQNSHSKTDNERRGLQHSLDDVRTRLEHLKMKRNKIAKKTSSNAVHQALMANKNEFPGLMDKLGFLGSIDPKYDVAVSTACRSLDNFVADGVKSAEAVVEFLRKRRLGRANIICLDELKDYSRNMQQMSVPQNSRRLFDLVEFSNDKVRPAFYHAMKDTLVVDNLNIANEVAFGPQRRWRVVTLDGKLIEESGTMSGGGTVQMRGRMSLSDGTSFNENTNQVDQQISTLEQETRQISEKYTACCDKCQELLRLVEDLKQQVAKADLDLSRHKHELQQSAKVRDNCERQVREIKAKLESLGEKASAQTSGDTIKRVQELISELEETDANAAQVQAKVDAIRAQVDDASGIEYRVLKTTIESETKEVESRSQQQARMQMKKKQCERQISESERMIDEATDELAKIIASQTEIQEKLDANTLKALEITKDITEARKKAEELEDKRADVESEMGQARSKLGVYKKQKSELTTSITDCEAKSRLQRTHVDQLSAKLREELRGLREEEDKWRIILPEESEPDEIVSRRSSSLATPRRRDSIRKKKAKTLSTMGSDEFDEEEDDNSSVKRLEEEIEDLKQKLLNTHANLHVLEEYLQLEHEQRSREDDLNAAVGQYVEQKAQTDALKQQRLNEFLSGFNNIALRLREMYQLITGGGDADLEQADSMDPFSEGILFSVMPPRKSWKRVQNLSGGEKTLASLALVFALHQFRPTPIYMMDEIDAALDFRNVSIVAKYIRQQTMNAQFIVISLRHNMFDLADRLVGVYKKNNCSQSVVLDTPK